MKLINNTIPILLLSFLFLISSCKKAATEVVEKTALKEVGTEVIEKITKNQTKFAFYK